MPCDFPSSVLYYASNVCIFDKTALKTISYHQAMSLHNLEFDTISTHVSVYTGHTCTKSNLRL